MTRFLAQHPSPWGWNPAQYGGLPAQFMYVPALHYAAAAGIWLFSLTPDRSWRLLTATLACLGPVSVFLFAFFFTRSRKWSLIAALAYLVFSPGYGLFTAVDGDRGFTHLPWRIQVLVKYGEGPHISGLAILPLALVGLWRCATGAGFRYIFAAAILLAAVVLANWVSALALAIACGLMLLCAVGVKDFHYRRVLAAAGLAYALSCFWLTPTFVHTIAFNWPADAFNFKMRAVQLWMLAAMSLVLVVALVCIWRLKLPFYVTYVNLSALVFGWFATGHYQGGFDMIPESRRYAVEAEMFAMLAICELLRQGWMSRNRVRQVCVVGSAALLLLAGVPQAVRYVTGGWARWRPVHSRETAEYRIAEWLALQRPEGRVLASGGLRFRMNAWFDLQQIGGTFESGVRNRLPHHLYYRIRTRPEVERAHYDLLGIEYIVVHGPKSEEFYRDYRYPAKFEGVFPKVYESGADVVYRVPFRGLADGMRALWENPSRLTLTGPASSSMLLRVNHDDGWNAWQNDRPIPVRRDSTGFIRLLPLPAADTTIRLEYGGTWEPKLMALLSAVAWTGSFVLLWRGRVRSVS